MSGLISMAAVTAVGIGAGLYENSQQQSTAHAALGLANNTEGKQDQYNSMLMQLMANPSSFLSNPLFTSALDTGTKGVNRTQAAEGFLGSGNQATALQQFGQSFASNQLTSQEQILASLSGAGNASSPSQALGASTAAGSASFNELGSLLASLGYTSKVGFGGSTPAAGGSGGPAAFVTPDDNTVIG